MFATVAFVVVGAANLLAALLIGGKYGILVTILLVAYGVSCLIAADLAYRLHLTAVNTREMNDRGPRMARALENILDELRTLNQNVKQSGGTKKGDAA